MKVLIVDDSDSNRKLLRLTLEAEGVTVHEAVDGVTALEALLREEFDAVISDILMPRMDGYRLFREIRRHPRLRNLPVIAYTSTYLTKGDEQFALQSGADRYLHKPAPAAVLLSALADLLRPGPTRRSEPAEPDDPGVMKEYNATLVRKLEEKSAELRERNAALGSAHHEVAESRARIEGIIASAMDAFVAVDEAAGIVLFNAAAETMFGTPAADMLGRPLAHLLPGQFGLGDARLGRSFAAAGPTPGSAGGFAAIIGKRANGEEFPIEASSSVAEVAGKRFFTVILRDISERKRAEEQLRQANEQLRALTARNETIRERERTAVAREIHDVLAQELTCLKIDLVWVARKAAQPIDESGRELLLARTKDAIAQTDAAIVTVQRIATQLRPVILDSLGLPAAIEWQVEDFGRRSGLACHARSPHGDSRLSRECATAVFRILQESLTNIARHAGATQADVDFLETAECATLVVADNGRGITPAQIESAHSIGLAGMRERAQAFGGTVKIDGATGAGTTVRVRITLDGKNTSPGS
jgi:PAS domain S-box-containing protein